MANFICYILFIIGGFLSGSILFCRIIVKAYKKQDILEVSEDGNPGVFNAIKQCGFGIGLICLLLELLKGIIPVLFASYFMPHNTILFSLVMLAPILGHALGVFDKFHGGKCIAVSFGVMIGITPITCLGLVLLLVFYLFFFAIVRIKSHKTCSIVTFACFAIVSGVVFIFQNMLSLSVGCVLTSVIVIVKHVKIAHDFIFKDI